MGTSLNGLTPASTYQGLIKTTDNAAISGTAKFLSDGLGNDSAFALSTTAVGVKTNSPVHPVDVVNDGGTGISTRNAASNYSIMRLGTDNVNGYSFIQNGKAGTGTTLPLAFRFDSAEAMRITSTGNVGIGITAPTAKLHLLSTSSDYAITAENTVSGQQNFLLFRAGANIGDINRPNGTNNVRLNVNFGSFVFGTDTAGSPTERFRITDNGVTFNGDTAAANALDDYEEGTWTPSLGGNTTYTGQVGTYTKIGRQVTVHFVVGVTTLGTGSAANITGLPFTSFSSNRGAGGVAFIDAPSTGYASINPAALVNSTTLAFTTSTILGVWADQSNVFTDGTTIAGTVTYFV
jgi:hypothetical protein